MILGWWGGMFPNQCYLPTLYTPEVRYRVAPIHESNFAVQAIVDVETVIDLLHRRWDGQETTALLFIPFWNICLQYQFHKTQLQMDFKSFFTFPWCLSRNHFLSFMRNRPNLHITKVLPSSKSANNSRPMSDNDCIAAFYSKLLFF